MAISVARGETGYEGLREYGVLAILMQGCQNAIQQKLLLPN